MPSDTIINLWPNCKPGFLLMLFVLSCKTWNVAKLGAWLARPPQGAQQSQDSCPSSPMVLQVLHAQQAVTYSHSQSGQCPGTLEARSGACSALSLKPKQEYSLNSPTGGQSIGASASASVLPVNIRGWFPLGLTGLISLQSKGLSRVFFSTSIWKHRFFGAQISLWFNSHIHTWLLEKPWLWLYEPCR